VREALGEWIGILTLTCVGASVYACMTLNEIRDALKEIAQELRKGKH